MDPEPGKIYELYVWEDRRSVKGPMVAGPWTEKSFSTDFDAGGEGLPTGLAVAVAHSHNNDPRQVLQFVLRDAVHGFIEFNVSFDFIEGGYHPAGQARWLMHRDFPWQDMQLRVLGIVGGKLYRVYTWWYIVKRSFLWDGRTWIQQ